MITDIQHDGMKWTVTIKDKYIGESFFLIVAVYIATWKFMFGSLSQ